MAKQKFYVVWNGRRTGVFTDWSQTQAQVDKFPGARFKSFATREEADQAFRSGASTHIVSKRTGTTRSAAKVKDSGEGTSGGKTHAGAAVRIYCDGACDPNPGNAGSGLAVYRGKDLEQLWYGLYNPCGTNNTAELNALHQALLMAEQAIAADESVQVLSDSKYAINCISVWARGWEQNEWRKATGPIRNLEIIQASYELYNRIKSEVRLSHVSAHRGTEGNELADRMAMLAVRTRQRELRLYDGELDIPALLRLQEG